MDKIKPTISVNVPVITDQTYIINKDKDVEVILTPPAVAVDSITMPDGTMVTGDNLTTQAPATTTTLGSIKARIADYQNQIDQANKMIDEANAKLAELENQLPEVQSAVDEATKDWKPTKIDATPVEQLPLTEQITP